MNSHGTETNKEPLGCQDDNNAQELNPLETDVDYQELQMAVDMLAELSWKFALSIAILQDHKVQLGEEIDLSHLSAMEGLLHRTVEQIDQFLETGESV